MKCLCNNSTALQKAREEERRTAIRVLTVTIAVTALDKCGLCRNTVEKLLKGAVDKADSINKNYIKIDDLEKMLEDEYDFKIRFEN